MRYPTIQSNPLHCPNPILTTKASASLHIHSQPPNKQPTGKPPPNTDTTNNIHTRKRLPPPPLNVPATQLPHHIAVIMDGNGRWARKQGLPVSIGHKRGVETLRRLVQLSAAWGIRCLTVYALSSENFSRPAVEVAYLLKLFEDVLRDEVEELSAEGVALRFMGEILQLPTSLQTAIARAENATQHNTRLTLNIAINYGAKNDITVAVQHIARQVASGQLSPDDITADLISDSLSSSRLHSPDLVIRSGGEQRLSNFLLWESAYSELYFSQLLWPEFDDGEFAAAIEDYSYRERRFGRREGS